MDNTRKSKGRSQSRLSRYARTPMRLLCRARDLYVQRLTWCAGNMSYGGGNADATIGLPPASMSTLPRNFSVSSASDDDFRELMRVASKRTLVENKFGGTPSPQHQLQRCSPASCVAPAPPKPKGSNSGMMPARSLSHAVGIPRIDEDNPSDFAQDNTTHFFYPRSRSCALVTKTSALPHY